jgi:hypothetical protein
MHKVRPTRVIGTFLADMCKVDRAGCDDLQNETITEVRKVMFATNELRWRGSEGTNPNRT